MPEEEKKNLVNSDIIKAGVIGYPIKHSLSPVIHGFWLDEFNINGSYDKLAIPPKFLETAIKELIHNGYKGFNLTIPHKELALDFIDEIDEMALKIGAINTVKVNNDGRTYGYNTDIYGFIQNLKLTCPDWDCKKPVTIIGAGGAAKAITMGLIMEDVEDIRIYNRSGNRVDELINHFANITDREFKITKLSLNSVDSALKDTELLVNCTSLGMIGYPEFNINITSLPKESIVYDIIYNPNETKLLKMAKNKGCKTINGIGMLIYQAMPGFKSWFGIEPEYSIVLENKLLEKLK